jgi:hypothetical protein
MFESQQMRGGAGARRERGSWLIGSAVAVAVLLLLSLALGLMVNVAIVRGSRSALDAAEAVRAQTVAKLADYVAEVAELSVKTEAVKAEQARLNQAAKEQAAAQLQERERTKADLVRFSSWFQTENARLAKILNGVRSQIEALTRSRERVDRELDEMRARLAERGSPAANAAARTAGGLRGRLISLGGPGVTATRREPLPAPAAVSTAADEYEKPVPSPFSDSVYEGNLVNGLPEGAGTCVYANGNRYEGSFKQGQKHGRGTFAFANGDSYEGEYVADIREGQGVYRYQDGSRYEGAFRNGLRQGTGRYVYRGGGEYTGEFNNGKRDGRGCYTFPDGVKLEGRWQNDGFVGP